ncbi:hypothetical protein ABKN59_006921 [Abortiporus biennis]
MVLAMFWLSNLGNQHVDFFCGMNQALPLEVRDRVREEQKLSITQACITLNILSPSLPLVKVLSQASIQTFHINSVPRIRDSAPIAESHLQHPTPVVGEDTALSTAIPAAAIVNVDSGSTCHSLQGFVGASHCCVRKCGAATSCYPVGSVNFLPDLAGRSVDPTLHYLQNTDPCLLGTKLVRSDQYLDEHNVSERTVSHPNGGINCSAICTNPRHII